MHVTDFQVFANLKMEIFALMAEDDMKPQMNSKGKISAAISYQQSFLHLDSKAMCTYFKLSEVCKHEMKRNTHHWDNN